MSRIAPIAAASAALIIASASSASLLASADFSTYADGALVGQNGWAQFGSSSTSPLTVGAGRVTWAGNGNTSSNHQDAFLAFASQITQPTVGTTILNFDILLSVSSAGAAGSYFAALNQNTTSGTSGNFQNVRMVAQASGAGYVFGTRLNGQSGYPFGYGTQVLNFGETYALRAEINLVAGNANDFINLYVGSDFSNLSLYGTAGYGAGTVSDISVGAMLLSQFSSGTAFESGVSVASMSVTLVPTPGALALLGVAGLVARRRRR
jgi:MYXO-CTERM domain-containing protein